MKIQLLGWGLVANTILSFMLYVFATRPHPSYCIFHIASTCGGAVTSDDLVINALTVIHIPP